MMINDYVDITINKHGGNQMSNLANLDVVDMKETQRMALYEAFLLRGEVGDITENVYPETGIRINSAYPRVSELKRSGRLVETKRMKAGASGSMARVLVADVYALKALTETDG